MDRRASRFASPWNTQQSSFPEIIPSEAMNQGKFGQLHL